MTNAIRNRFLFAAMALALGGCGVEFDSIGMLDGLRVLGIRSDQPVAHPGDTIEMQMVVHDTGDREGKPRDLSYLWLGGCDNPPGDTYQGCVLLFSKIASSFRRNISSSSMRSKKTMNSSPPNRLILTWSSAKTLSRSATA